MFLSKKKEYWSMHDFLTVVWDFEHEMNGVDYYLVTLRILHRSQEEDYLEAKVMG